MASKEEVPPSIPRRHSPRLTATMAAQIRVLYFKKKWMQHDIAAHFGINQGRVSEVISGKRFPEDSPPQSSLPF
jgi:hypothetical protein